MYNGSGTISPIANIHWCKSQAVEVEIPPFAVIPIKLPVDFFLYTCPCKFESCLFGSLESP